MKTIVYEYLFNYFGGDTYKGKIVTGANILLAIRPYKNGKEVKFEDRKELSTNNKYLCDVFTVRFDREKLFVVEKNLYIDNLFRLVFGFSKIQAEIIGYGFSYLVGESKDCFPDLHLPKAFEKMPVSENMEIPEGAFRKFLSAHIEDFDISDNRHAQILSVAFL